VRVVAIDWSGRRVGAGAAICLAEARESRLVRVEGGREREDVVDHLVAEAEHDPDLVVGLDFAFSFPAWFVHERGARSGPEFWELAERDGERWLRECREPFWRTAGVPRLPPERAHRRTELELDRVAGVAPTSVFKLVGPSQVGPGSVRGMPCLARLRRHGFSIWPFDSGLPLAVEIWPRALTGVVAKSDRGARHAYLAGEWPEIGEPLRGVAASTDDAFDAAVSAAVMSRHVEELRSLGAKPDRAIEGEIWVPSGVHRHEYTAAL
jgi:hypothetical protein